MTTVADELLRCVALLDWDADRADHHPGHVDLDDATYEARRKTLFTHLNEYRGTLTPTTATPDYVMERVTWVSTLDRSYTPAPERPIDVLSERERAACDEETLHRQLVHYDDQTTNLVRGIEEYDLTPADNAYWDAQWLHYVYLNNRTVLAATLGIF